MKKRALVTQDRQQVRVADWFTGEDDDFLVGKTPFDPSNTWEEEE